MRIKTFAIALLMLSLTVLSAQASAWESRGGSAWSSIDSRASSHWSTRRSDSGTTLSSPILNRSVGRIRNFASSTINHLFALPNQMGGDLIQFNSPSLRERQNKLNGQITEVFSF